MICGSLHRFRPETILTYSSEYSSAFFRACGLATKDHSDRLLADAEKSASRVFASFSGSPYGLGARACLGRLGVGGKNERFASSTLGARRLAPVRRRDAHSSSRRGPRCGLAWDRARL